MCLKEKINKNRCILAINKMSDFLEANISLIDLNSMLNHQLIIVKSFAEF
jgi:hypothetical protein